MGKESDRVCFLSLTEGGEIEEHHVDARMSSESQETHSGMDIVLCYFIFLNKYLNWEFNPNRCMTEKKIMVQILNLL